MDRNKKYIIWNISINETNTQMKGLENLQHAGICHRDISLENLLVHNETGALIIDMGMCLLLPMASSSSMVVSSLSNNNHSNNHPPGLFGSATSQLSPSPVPLGAIVSGTTVSTSVTSSTALTTSFENLNLLRKQSNDVPFSSTPSNNGYNNNTNNVTTISRRYMKRYLVQPQGTCGKWIYMSPEILKNKEPFDGFAVDMWAAGVILFLMLTGFPPWERACLTDERFKYMAGGYLVQMLTEWDLGISSDALDLLQRMLFYDPKDRLSLDQVRAHPWMLR